MNLKELKKLHMNDTTAGVVARLEKKLAPVAGLALRGIVFPEQAKAGGFVLMTRDRRNIRRTAFAALAAVGADEDALKAVAGLHAQGKAALLCSVLDKVTGGRLFAPRGVKEAAASYVADLRRADYCATWHNLSIDNDFAYRYNFAALLAEKAGKAVTAAVEALDKKRDAKVSAESVRAAAADDLHCAQARAAVELGEHIAEMQNEVEEEEEVA